MFEIMWKLAKTTKNKDKWYRDLVKAQAELEEPKKNSLNE